MQELEIKSRIVVEFLKYRQWEIVDQRDRFIRLKPPRNLDISENYTLIVPSQEDAPDYSRTIIKITNIISQIYSISETKLSNLFSKDSTIFSFKLEDKMTLPGSVQLRVVEELLVKLKKAIMDIASATSLGSPLFESITAEAATYFNNCKYLQTEHGSFVTNIQLPSELVLKQANLYGGSLLTAEDINNRISEYLQFSINEIFEENENIYSDEFFEENQHLMSAQILNDIKELIKKTECENVHFNFISKKYSKDISARNLTEEKFEYFSKYIQFVKEKVESNIEIDIVGKIVELRSRNPQSDKNYISVRAKLERQSIFLAMHLNNIDYQMAIQAHKNNSGIRVKGLAKKMKTQYKITALEFIEIS